MDEGAPTLDDETSDNNLLAWCVHYYFPSRLGLCDSCNKSGGGKLEGGCTRWGRGADYPVCVM